MNGEKIFIICLQFNVCYIWKLSNVSELTNDRNNHRQIYYAYIFLYYKWKSEWII